ncbi:unnamed protein product [Rotaria sordida]|uniref:Uncharacterized protein n=1 Tax=Rotaria sordida TaxID=392033 RepID=A0A813X329_9BILA|nr:unnamed protein product [Rotaria sordida]
MEKFLYLAVLYFVIGLTLAFPGDFLLSFFNLGKYFRARTPTSICKNTTISQSYLSQILSLINNLQADSLYNSVLQIQMANVVSYLQDTTNQALLLTNCTTFVTNLKAAKSVDKTAERTRQQIASDIHRPFQQVVRNATRSNAPYEFDSDEDIEHLF